MWRLFGLERDVSRFRTPHAMSMNMEIIFPEKLGKVIKWGMDLSPEAKNYVELIYRLDEDQALRAVSGKVNRNWFDLDSQKEPRKN